MALTLDGSLGATLPNGTAPLTGNGLLLNIQYFTTAGTATYTPTTGTNFVVVDVVGGGGGSYSASSSANGGTGGTSSFGALVSATGGGPANSAGSGSGGDLNLTGQRGASIGAGTAQLVPSNGGITGLSYQTYGCGAYTAGSTGTTTSMGAGAGGGAARKKITSSFSGVTVTVGAAGTAGTGGNAGGQGIVVVYEYA